MGIGSFGNFINLNFFSRMGFKVERIERTFEAKRSSLISIIQPDLVIDGGANTGQWAVRIGGAHPSVRIWSFEPLRESRLKLEKTFSTQNLEWKIFPFALGEKKQNLTINIASNSQMSSSFLQSSLHSVIHPEISFESQREINVISLDSLQDELQPFNNIYLKLDVQGFEMAAILGTLKIIEKVSVIEVESSFTPLYVGETAHHELIVKIKSLGFTPFFISVPHAEPSGRQFALDTILVRNELITTYQL
jgi:FkbM family methyltransferase